MNALAAPLTCLILLTACTIGPDYREPTSAALPPRYMGDDGSPATHLTDAAWWHDFGDPQLDALVSAALRDNPDLQAADARRRQARAESGIAAAALSPTLQARGKLARDQLSRNGESFANMPLANPQTAFTDHLIGFDASWELDIFGRNTRTLEAASARAEAVAEQHHDVILLIAADVARFYLDYRNAQRRLVNLGAEIAADEESLRLMLLSQQAGLASATDVDAARSSLENARAAEAAPAMSARISLASLAALLARDGRALQTELGAPGPERMLAATLPPGLPSELLQRRPDIRRAERERAAASADIGSAMAARYPSISLTGSAGFDAIHSGSLTESASRFWSMGPSLTLPLFNAGRLRDQVEANRAAFDAADADYRKTVLAALADTEGALIRFQRECARAQELSRSAAAAAHTRSLTDLRRQAGDASRLDVLAADVAWRTQLDARLSAANQCETDRVALFKALGGGWNTATGQGDLLTSRIPEK